MDLAKILKSVGADKPKQTRPAHADVLHYAVQYNWGSRWHFCHDSLLPQATSLEEMTFVDGKRKVEELQSFYPSKVFRLVAVVEVS